MSHPDVPPEAWAGVHRGPLREGEWVRLVDAKGRRHNFCLEAGKRFFSNRGHVEHDELIGRELEVLVDHQGEARSHREAPEIDGVVQVPDDLSPGTFHRVQVVDALGPDLVARPV